MSHFLLYLWNAVNCKESWKGSNKVAEEPPGAKKENVGEDNGARLAKTAQAGETVSGVEPGGEDEGGSIGNGEKKEGIINESLGETQVEKGVDGALGAASGTVQSCENVERATGQPG